MIANLLAGDGANTLLVVASGVRSNHIPRHLPAGAREGLAPSASEAGVDA